MMMWCIKKSVELFEKKQCISPVERRFQDDFFAFPQMGYVSCVDRGHIFEILDRRSSSSHHFFTGILLS